MCVVGVGGCVDSFYFDGTKSRLVLLEINRSLGGGGGGGG